MCEVLCEVSREVLKGFKQSTVEAPTLLMQTVSMQTWEKESAKVGLDLRFAGILAASLYNKLEKSTSPVKTL